MNGSFAEWFATSPLAAAARVFVATVLAMAVADWAATGAIGFTSWQPWVIAACASTLPVVLRWLNPADVEFGRGAIEFTPFDVWGDEDEDDNA